MPPVKAAAQRRGSRGGDRIAPRCGPFVRPRLGLRLALVSLSLALSGCGPQAGGVAGGPTSGLPRIPLADLRGQLLGAPPLLVLQASAWKEAGGGGWSFEADEATVDVLANGPQRQELRFVFRVPAGVELRATWDEAAVEVSRPDAERRSVAISPRQLASGRHRLRIVPENAGGSTPGRVEWIAEEGSTLPTADARWARIVRQQVDLGITGRARTLRDGFVTLGAWRARIDLGSEAGGTFVAFLENGSGRDGRVEAIPVGREEAATGLELAKATQGLLRLQVPAGTRFLDLAVRGAGELDAWVWGGPFFLQGSPRVPTVVLLSLDTTRRDALGVYGGPADTTPRLDRFAAEATRFTRASSTTSWTLPSHASMFTGLYPAEHGAGVSATGLARRFETLAELLSGSHVTLGFAAGGLLRQPYGLGQGFGLYEVPWGKALPGDPVVDRALDTLAELDGLPVFLFVNLFDAHYPYAAEAGSPHAARFAAALDRIPAGDPWRDIALGEGETWRELRDARLPASAAGREALRHAYLGGVATVDRLVGRILDALARAGRLDTALVAIVSDHGEMLGERGLHFHSARLDPELVDIPLLVRFPGQRAARLNELPVSLVDLYPTLLRAAGVAPPASRGLELHATEQLARRGGVWFEETETADHVLRPLMRLAGRLSGIDALAGRRVEWGAGEACHGAPEIGRTVAPCLPEIRRLHAAWNRELGFAAGAAPEAGRSELDAQERARLDALGYL